MKKVQPSVGKPLRSAGFTILELMIAVSILGILLGIGVPSFTGMIRQNRLATQTNDLLTAAAVTRSEAVKRGAQVTLCPANGNGDACANNAQWSAGWIVFNDDGPTPGTVEVGAGEVIIQRWPPAATQNVNISNVDGLTSISYLGSGATTLPAAGTNFTITGVQCTNPNGLRTINIIRAGRARATRGNCAG